MDLLPFVKQTFCLEILYFMNMPYVEKYYKSVLLYQQNINVLCDQHEKCNIPKGKLFFTLYVIKGVFYFQ